MKRRWFRIVAALALMAVVPGFSGPSGRTGGPPSSLVLIAGDLDGTPAYGCGVMVAENRDAVTIVTAAHNLQMTRRVVVTAAGERLRVMAARSIAGHDVALIMAERPWRAYAIARVAGRPAPGTRVHVWGPVKNEPFTLQDGIVREIDPRVNDLPPGAFAIDCAACGHGDSGSGVFDGDESLLGIVTASYSAGNRRLFVLGEHYLPEVASHPVREGQGQLGGRQAEALR
ncbi:MAG: trypsin-like peptidase domain-containing protein [Candidatus Eremiobacteraeota bacterium]|nr:trypsin-like peptidase domain-containing protein [Candidatus Eremiobacteraeota bacterium]